MGIFVGSLEPVIFKPYRQWTHVFKILREIDTLYEYYRHFYLVKGKIKNT